MLEHFWYLYRPFARDEVLRYYTIYAEQLACIGLTSRQWYADNDFGNWKIKIRLIQTSPPSFPNA
jgi:hypothetical protein